MASEKDATAEIIQHALAQEEEEKKQRKAEKEGASE